MEHSNWKGFGAWTFVDILESLRLSGYSLEFPFITFHSLESRVAMAKDVEVQERF